MIALSESTGTEAPFFARAIVRANNDPDKKGRIRVEYPWFHGRGANTPSEWARVCSPYASQDSGAWFLPENGDEVMVYFENGNLDLPIIFGSLYSDKNPPPKCSRTGDLNEQNKNNLKFIKTRSGHTLCFDDSDDKRAIVIRDKDKRKFEIDSKENKISLSDDKKNKVEINGATITVKNESGDTVTVDDGKITIKSSSGDEILLKGGIQIKSAGTIKLGAGALHSLVRGELFQALFNSHTHMTAWGPSSPPLMPMTSTVLNSSVKTN